jgi:hypothetical protein
MELDRSTGAVTLEQYECDISEMEFCSRCLTAMGYRCLCHRVVSEQHQKPAALLYSTIAEMNYGSVYALV